MQSTSIPLAIARLISCELFIQYPSLTCFKFFSGTYSHDTIYFALIHICLAQSCRDSIVVAKMELVAKL